MNRAEKLGKEKERTKRKTDSKVHSISKILTIIFIILTFIIIVFVVSFSPERDFLQCREDSECIKVLTTCCPCEMGGVEKCVPKRQQNLYLPQECPEKPICIAMYNCEVKDCFCIGNECTEIIGEKIGENKSI